MQPISQQPQRLISLPEVMRVTSLKKTSVYALIASGELRPVKLGRRTALVESEVFAWINAKLANRDAIKPRGI